MLEQAEFARPGDVIELASTGTYTDARGEKCVNPTQRLLCLGRGKFLPLKTGTPSIKVQGAFNLASILI
jgi:hypothetical protein